MSKPPTEVKIESQAIDESALNAEIVRVKSEIETWGRQNELWHKESFTPPFIYHGYVPQAEELCSSSVKAASDAFLRSMAHVAGALRQTCMVKAPI